MILVGESRVGKTSITTRYVDDSFNEDEASSRAVRFYSKTFDIPETDKSAQLHVWDTLGQEKWFAIAPVFFRGTGGAFIVFDLGNRESFDKLDRWIELTKKSVE